MDFGAVHKKRLQLGGRVFVQCGIFYGQGERSVLQMQTSTLFGAKNFRTFRNLWCVRTTRGGGLNQSGNFADKRVNFSQFCADFFYGRPLSHLKYFF